MKAWNKGMKFPYKPNYKLRGRIIWNKGLTKETDERVKEMLNLVEKERYLI